jgi:Universal stress protein family
MTSSISVPRAPHDQRPDEVAAAIARRLQGRSPGATVSSRTGAEGMPIIVISGSAAGTKPTVVVAAVDDDGNPGRVIGFAAAEARRLSVPLRVVHVWTGDGTAEGVRLCRHDRISDADRLLSAVLYDSLPAEEAAAAEREIRHDPDPVRALERLSADAALLVVAARSEPAPGPEPLGDTVRELVGRTACPLAVLPTHYAPEELARPCTW